MTSYLRKYVTALASAKDYVAQWSSDHVYADEELIVPFPTLALFDPKKHVWCVCIKAWIYLPFQNKSLTSYLPSLSSFMTGTKKEENIEKSVDEKDEIKTKKKTIFNEDEQKQTTNESQSKDSNIKVDQDKKETAAKLSEENHEIKKKDGSSDEGTDSDDDIYEDALRS